MNTECCRGPNESCRLRFFDLEDLYILVVTAVRAGVVRGFLLPAVRAADERNRGEPVVGPPLSPPCLGVSFWW